MAGSAEIAVTTVLAILVVANIIGNSLVCVIFIKYRELRIPINYLLVNLAVADMLFATFLASEFILSYAFTHPDGVTGTVLCRLLTGGTLGWLGGASSAFTLVAIAIERYYAVMYPLGNKGKLNKRKLKVIITSSWIFSLIVNFPGFLVTHFEKKNDGCVETFTEQWMGKVYSLVWLITTAAVPLSIIVSLYAKVVCTLWFNRNEGNHPSRQKRGVIKMRKRVTLMVVTVSAVFGISWGTSSVVYVLKFFTPYGNIGNAAITNTMALFNSAVNPFVYALLNQQFREKAKEMLCCGYFGFKGERRAEGKPESIELASISNHSNNEEVCLSRVEAI